LIDESNLVILLSGSSLNEQVALKILNNKIKLGFAKSAGGALYGRVK
jgi:hypothetical protein